MSRHNVSKAKRRCKYLKKSTSYLGISLSRLTSEFSKKISKNIGTIKRTDRLRYLPFLHVTIFSRMYAVKGEIHGCHLIEMNIHNKAIVFNLVLFDWKFRCWKKLIWSDISTLYNVWIIYAGYIFSKSMCIRDIFVCIDKTLETLENLGFKLALMPFMWKKCYLNTLNIIRKDVNYNFVVVEVFENKNYGHTGFKMYILIIVVSSFSEIRRANYLNRIVLR